MTRMIAGSLMLSVWLAGVLTGPVVPAAMGMSHAAPAHAHAGHRGETALVDRSDDSESCAHCGAGACLTMQGCSPTGCLVLYQASSTAGALSPRAYAGPILPAQVLWRTRSLAPPTPPPLAIHDRLA